jgi:hypothetical protein
MGIRHDFAPPLNQTVRRILLPPLGAERQISIFVRAQERLEGVLREEAYQRTWPKGHGLVIAMRMKDR